MDYSIFHLPTYRPGFAPSLHDFYNEIAETVRWADQLGWARVLTTEHHFHYYGGAVPNPAVMLAAWAAQTKQIRLSAGVSLVPLRHPLQVAEDYALVDHISNGRFDMGVSRGFVPHEFEPFGVQPIETADRVAEGVDIIRKFWKGEPFAHSGKFYKFAKLQPWPLTHQKEIPIWIAASNDLASFERVGKGGLRLMMNQYPMNIASLVEKHNTFKDAYAKAGHDPKRRKSMICFAAYLADTEEAAIETAKLAMQEHATAFLRCRTHDEWNTNWQGDISVLLDMCEGNDYRDVFRRRTMICTPEQAAERLSFYIEEGFTELSFMPRFGNITNTQAMETMERLTKEVKPMLGLAA